MATGSAYDVSSLPPPSAPPPSAPPPPTNPFAEPLSPIPKVMATPVIVDKKPHTPSRAPWIALSLLVTCIVGLIITSSLINNPHLDKTYLACLCITAAFSIAIMLGALFQYYRKEKKSPLAVAIAWAALALLTTCLAGLLVASFAPNNVLAPKVFYPIFSLVGAGSLLVIIHRMAQFVNAPSAPPLVS